MTKRNIKDISKLEIPKLQRTEKPLNERLQELNKKYNSNINEILSEEDKLKYCLIFGNKVFKKFDTFEEAIEYSNESKLYFTIFCPLKNMLENNINI